MSTPSPRSARRWSLRSTLLLPIVMLILLALVGLGLINEWISQQQTEALVSQRGQTALVGLTRQIEERLRLQRLYAELVTDQASLYPAVVSNDRVALAQLTVPYLMRFDLDYVKIIDINGTHLFSAQSADLAASTNAALQAARAGNTKAEVISATEGLVLAAARTIRDPSGIVGAVVVASRLDSEDLQSLRPQEDVDLALFYQDRLVATTNMHPTSVAILSASTGPLALDRLNQHLRPASLKAVSGGTTDANGELVALIDTSDIDQATYQRRLFGLGGIALLMLLVIGLGAFLTGRIARPLEAMATVTSSISGGDPSRRIQPSRIAEVDDLAHSINIMAARVEEHVMSLHRLAFHDSLTGLPNRALFLDRLHQAMSQAFRHGEAVAVLFVDLDDFKSINDRFGHQTGDAVLIQVAERLRRAARTEDMVARLAGDEFAVVVERLVDDQEAVAIAERVARSLQEVIQTPEQLITTSASVGVAVSTGFHSPEDLLREADQAMYRGKARGKNTVAVYSQRPASTSLWSPPKR